MNANTDTLSARGVHRDEYERDREYHQNYEPHDQYSRWETTGAQWRGHDAGQTKRLIRPPAVTASRTW
jgi:hypothetical protein